MIEEVHLVTSTSNKHVRFRPPIPVEATASYILLRPWLETG